MTARSRTLLLDKSRQAIDALQLLAPNDAAAIQEGRLFADKHRVTQEQQHLVAGQTITLYAPRQPSSLAQRTDVPRLLGQREGLIAVYKPAAWSSEPDQTGTELCLSHHLKKQYDLRELHVATRLDVGVSGLVLVATGPERRRHLARLVDQGTLHRCYLAVASGKVNKQGQWTGAVENSGPGKPRDAVTNYECLARVLLEGSRSLGNDKGHEDVSLLRFLPQTGRRHQLRIHASRHGHPLLGDRRYGGPKQLILEDGRVFPLSRILLQAVSTELPLPSGETWYVHCPLDEEVERFWKLLGGIDADFPK